MSILKGNLPDVTQVIHQGIAANFKTAIAAHLRAVAEAEIEAIATKLSNEIATKVSMYHSIQNDRTEVVVQFDRKREVSR